MLEAGGSSEHDVDLYGSPKKGGRKAPKSFRIAPNLQRGLDALQSLWRVEAIARGDDPNKITASHVVNRLLEVGLDSAFQGVKEDAGLKDLPVSAAEWAAFDQALDRRLAKKP